MDSLTPHFLTKTLDQVERDHNRISTNIQISEFRS